jgi:hypothetical protein
MTIRLRKPGLRAIGAALLASVLVATLAACAGPTASTGGARAAGNPAGSWRWDTRGPPGYISSGFRGGDMS